MQESSGQSGSVLKEHDYIGLSEASSASATMNDSRADVECPLEDTDLRLELGLGLGLGSGFQDRLVKHFRKEAEGEAKVAQVTKSVTTQSESTYPSSLSELPRGLAPPTLKNGVKRVYSEAMATADARFHMIGGEIGLSAIATAARKNAEADVKALPKHQQQSSFLPNWAPSKPTVPSWCAVGLEQPAHTYAPSNSAVMAGALKHNDFSENSQEPATADTPPSKGQVVGWPPVRSFRRQTLAKPAETFVKVNMDGITVGRKVDLNSYTSYESLLLALEEMFQPLNSAQGAPQVISGRENDLKHFLLASGSDFVLTYEDKDGDWMLVGDVPWSMFISTVRRLRITRGSEANGPAQRRPEKSRYHV